MVVLSPEIEVGEAILQRLAHPGAFDVIHIDSFLLVAGIVCDHRCPILGETMRDVRALCPDLSATIMSVLREGALQLPSSGDVLQDRDVVYGG